MTKKFSRTVIFDGDCGFCLRSVRIGKTLDWCHRIDWRARLEAGVKEAFPQISDEDSLNRMLSIRPDGKVVGGFFAVRDILIHCPLTSIPALFLYLPGVSLVGVPLYQWIAKNRHRFPGSKNPDCSIR